MSQFDLRFKNPKDAYEEGREVEVVKGGAFEVGSEVEVGHNQRVSNSVSMFNKSYLG